MLVIKCQAMKIRISGVDGWTGCLAMVNSSSREGGVFSKEFVTFLHIPNEQTSQITHK